MTLHDHNLCLGSWVVLDCNWEMTTDNSLSQSGLKEKLIAMITRFSFFQDTCKLWIKVLGFNLNSSLFLAYHQQVIYIKQKVVSKVSLLLLFVLFPSQEQCYSRLGRPRTCSGRLNVLQQHLANASRI